MIGRETMMKDLIFDEEATESAPNDQEGGLYNWEYISPFEDV